MHNDKISIKEVWYMESLYNLIMNIINSISVYGIIVTSLLIIFESIIPPLPLCVFITLLFINYGNFYGFLLSWILTVIGCIMSFFIFRKLLKNKTDKYLMKYKKLNKYMNLISNINFSNLVLIISIPFTPAFLVNVVSGISNVSFKKFIFAIIIGKISLVLFWGLIGTSLIESIKNPSILVFIILLVTIFYIFSKIVNKKLKID